MGDTSAYGAYTQALVAAVKRGHLDTLRALLASNGPVDAVDENGRTALMYAASYEDERVDSDTLPLSMVQLLLNSGSDVNISSPTGETAIMLAATKVNADVVDILLKRGAKPHVKVVDRNTIEVSGGRNEPKPITTFRLSIGPDVYRGQYTSSGATSAWSRPASDRANKTFNLLKAMRSR